MRFGPGSRSSAPGSRALAVGAAAAVVLGLIGAPAAQAAPVERQAVIVQLRSPADVRAVVVEQGRAGGTVDHVYGRVLDGFAAELPAPAVAALRRDPRVRAVTPDIETRASTTQPAPPWGLDRIDQRTASLDSAYSYDTTGTGVTVYVVDSGVRLSHSDFGGRMTSGYDYVDSDTDASDCHGHGTHVSGTILGSTYGVAKQARGVSLRVWGCDGSGLMSDMIAAFDYAVANRRGPSLINLSGGGAAYAPMDEAVARATAAGLPVVVAAGNESTNACTRSPAAAPSALTVGATDSTDARASFSNYGSCIDLFAPGVGILSGTNTSNTARESWSGTSMAAPHVAGVAARHLQRNPGATPAQVTQAITGAATAGIVTGSLSANNRLLHAAPPDTTDVTAPTVSRRTPASSATAVVTGANVTATFNEAVQGVSGTSVTLRSAAGAAVGATVTYDATGRVATLNPTSNLAADTRYTATLAGGGSGIRDLAGNALVGSSWTFLTGPRPTVATRTPAVGATGVGRTANVTASFSEAVQGVSGSSVTLRTAGGAAVTATVTYNATNRTVTLNPGPTLAAGSRYTATLTGGATAIRDLAGNPITTASWSFTTAAG